MRHQSGSERSLPVVCASAASAVTSWAENSSVSRLSAVAMAVTACRYLAVRPSRTSEAGTSGDSASLRGRQHHQRGHRRLHRPEVQRPGPPAQRPDGLRSGRRQPDAFRANRSTYEIAEPLITFYHAVMRPIWSDLAHTRNPSRLWERSEPRFTSNVLGRISSSVPVLDQVLRSRGDHRGLSVPCRAGHRERPGLQEDPADRCPAWDSATTGETPSWPSAR